MKKNVKVLACLVALIGCIGVGGAIANADEDAYVGIFGNMFNSKGEHIAEFNDVDEASLEVFNNVYPLKEFANENIDPHRFVKSLKGRTGEDVDFSELEMSFKKYDLYEGEFKDVSADEILDENGLIDIKKVTGEYNYIGLIITFTYNYYSVMIEGMENSITKRVMIDNSAA